MTGEQVGRDFIVSEFGAIPEKPTIPSFEMVEARGIEPLFQHDMFVDV